jgi:nitrogen fixation protein NifU and related proteins
MVYAEELLDHFQHPRNVGELAVANAVAEGENPVCGDRLRLELRIQDDVIEEVAWQVEGCVPAIAAASAASELLRGRSVQAARQLDRAALDQALGGVPPRKTHALSLVLTTVSRALDAFPSASHS